MRISAALHPSAAGRRRKLSRNKKEESIARKLTIRRNAFRRYELAFFSLRGEAHRGLQERWMVRKTYIASFTDAVFARLQIVDKCGGRHATAGVAICLAGALIDLTPCRQSTSLQPALPAAWLADSRLQTFAAPPDAPSAIPVQGIHMRQRLRTPAATFRIARQHVDDDSQAAFALRPARPFPNG